MKRISILLLAAAFFYPQFTEAQDKTEIKVMSYNMRTANYKDGDNSWKFRKPATTEMLKDQLPDVFGVQEALPKQIRHIRKFNRNYVHVGVGRDTGSMIGEHAAVFWNTNTVNMLDWGTIWLSETPDIPSVGWDAKHKRTATWALMEYKATGEKFYFVNAHLDHAGGQAQKNGLSLVMDMIGEKNSENLPVVILGDFNVTPSSGVLTDIEARMKNARKVAPKTDNTLTYTGFGLKTNNTLDYIYYLGFSECPEYETVVKEYSGKPYVSDHYPIQARLIF